MPAIPTTTSAALSSSETAAPLARLLSGVRRGALVPVATITAPYAIAGCAFVPLAGNGPCVMGQWIVGTVRVVSQGQPLAIMTGVSICTPTGTPMLPVAAQTRVLAT